MMDLIEREAAKKIRDSLKRILTDLKLAYYNAKRLDEDYGWDTICLEMSEAYMNFAEEYFKVMEALEKEEGETK